MIATPVLLIAVWLAAAPQSTEDGCRRGAPAAESTTRLEGGFTVRVRPSGRSVEPCEIVLEDRAGRSVFVSAGFSARIHPATGQDIDNDGRPDAVLGVDTRGERECCWEFAIVSLSANPRVLAKLPAVEPDRASSPGTTVIWLKSVFPELGPDEDDPPAAWTAHQFRSNGLIEVTRDLCHRLLAGELRGPADLRNTLSDLSARSRQQSRTETGDSRDRERTRRAATTLTVQMLYCGQVDEASRLVREVWPPAEQNLMRMRFKSAIQDRRADIAAGMTAWN